MIEPSDADISECPDSVIEYIHELEAENRAFHKDALAFESILNERLEFHKDSEADFVTGYKLGVRRFEDLYLCGAGQVLKQQYAKERIKALESVLNQMCPVSGPVLRDSESRQILQREVENLKTELQNV